MLLHRRGFLLKLGLGLSPAAFIYSIMTVSLCVFSFFPQSKNICDSELSQVVRVSMLCSFLVLSLCGLVRVGDLSPVCALPLTRWQLGRPPICTTKSSSQKGPVACSYLRDDQRWQWLQWTLKSNIWKAFGPYTKRALDSCSWRLRGSDCCTLKYKKIFLLILSHKHQKFTCRG